MTATDIQPELEALVNWQAALARQAETLRAQLQGIQSELAQVEERLTLVTKLLDVESRARSRGEGTSPDGQTSARPDQNPVEVTQETTDLEGAVEVVLRAAGKPLHISTIRAALVERGVPIPGRGDDANIIVRLRRFEDRFTRTARGTYGLAEWGIPAMAPKKRAKRRTASR